MKNVPFLLFIFLNVLCFDTFAQEPQILWQRCTGGSGLDAGYHFVETDDHRFIVSSTTNSQDGDINLNNGLNDGSAFSLNQNGELVSVNVWGGSLLDGIYAIGKTDYGGYILAGTSESNDKDILGNHGGVDVIAMQVDADMKVLWQRSLGGPLDENIRSVVQTTDGGFFLVGSSKSSWGDVRINKGNWDMWAIKLNSCGQIEWQKTFGGTESDYAYAGLEDNDGNFVVGGFTYSFSGDVTGNHGIGDYWVVKLNPSGNLIWQKCFGGSGQDEGRTISLASDGSYLVNGWTDSANGDVPYNNGGRDMWVINVNQNGDLVWGRVLGGSLNDVGYDVFETAEGNFVMLGYAGSSDGDVSGNHGALDAWVVQMDGSGSINWQISLGGSGNDELRYIKRASDGDYVLSGFTQSNDGDVTGHHADLDAWTVKLTGVTGLIGSGGEKEPLLVYPNPAVDYLYLPGYSGNLLIYAADGKVVTALKKIENLKRIDISRLPAGVYTLRLLDKEKEYQGKFTKQ